MPNTAHEKANLVALGRELYRLRRERATPQAELARSAGVGVATLRRMEDGRDARMGSWIRVLGALGFDDPISALIADQAAPKARPRAPRVRSDPSRRPSEDDFINL